MGKQQQGRSSRYPGSAERLLYPVVVPVAAAHQASDQLADLDEEDVWSVLDCSSANSNRLLQPELQEHRGGRRATAAGGLSLAFEAAAGTRNHQQQHRRSPMGGAASSAPLKVPAEQWLVGRPPMSSCREEEEAAEWVAPHEYLQSRRGSSSSGRTLKGRDLSRVRDAVWSNTGFLG